MKPSAPQTGRPTGPKNRWAILVAIMALGTSAATLVRTIAAPGPRISSSVVERERQIQSAIDRAEAESASRQAGQDR